MSIEVSAVPLRSGGRVIGVFGQVKDVDEEEAPAPHPHLTPRQSEVLRLLERGRSTEQIALEFQLSMETFRVAGENLGTSVANWELQRNFQPIKGKDG